MAVFGTLMGLVFWVFVYLCCCAKDKNDEREQVKLLRYVHEAKDYKEICNYMDEVCNYYYNELDSNADFYEKRNQLMEHFPALKRNTYVGSHSDYKSTLMEWAARSKMSEIKDRYAAKYKSKYQNLKEPFCMEAGMIAFHGYRQEEYERRLASDKKTNEWVDQMREKYFVTGPIN